MVASCRKSLVPRAVVAGVVALALSGRAHSDEPKVKPASRANQHITGVIVKSDLIKSEDGKATVRKVVLTINTAAVWRDWVRDQTAERPNQSARKDAREGVGSVATKGEPADKNTLVKVEVPGDSPVATRFRAPDDETGRGQSARSVQNESKGAARQAAKPTQFKLADLKPGLFVESDFARKDERNVASTLSVVRPLPPPEAAK